MRISRRRIRERPHTYAVEESGTIGECPQGMTAASPVFPYKIRRRMVVAGNGACSIESVVPCVARGPIPVKTCISCEHSAGVIEDGADRCSYLLCAVPPQVTEATPAVRPSRGQPSLAERTRVAEVMTSNVVCVREEMTVEALTGLLLDRGISGVPVVDAGGYPLGVVSKTDIVRESYQLEHSSVTEWIGFGDNRGGGFDRDPFGRATVGDIMMPLAFTLYEDSSLSQAAAMMAIEEVHRIPVVSDEGKVVGLLSALDMMRWMARQDGYPLWEITPERSD